MDALNPHPNDNAELKQLLSLKDAQLQQKDSQLAKKQKRIDLLEAQLRLQQQKRFGASSEQHKDPLTLNLFNEAEVIVDHSQLTEDESIEVPAHKRRKSSRVLDDKLPRVDVIHDLADEDKTCDSCQAILLPIKDDALEQLAIIPAQYYVIRHIRKRYACSCKACIKTASMPKQVLPKSQASPQLLAYLMVAKYFDGLPLYRLEKMAAREGMSLPRDKTARWLIQSSELLQPVINLCEDQIQHYDIAMGDETGIQVLKETDRSPESKSYLWLRRGGPPDKPVVLVDYSPSRSGKIPLKLFDGFKGYLVTDAYAGYNPVMERQRLTFVACNDHARRKFKEAHQSLPKKQRKKTTVADQALSYYKRLYKIERNAKNLNNEERLALRQREALPLWAEFRQWLEQMQQAGVYDEKTRTAINYLLGHFDAMTRYCEDGRLPISNIQCEHVAKTIAIARKNFMFCDTPKGASASARIYSILETAKANGHHPRSYLTVLLTELPLVETVEGYEALLPWNLTPALVKEKMAGYPTLSLGS